MKAINTLDIKKIIKNGFRSCGLYPFNANAVDYNILNKKKKTKSSKNSDQNSDQSLVSDESGSSDAIEVQKFIIFFEKSILDPVTLQEFKEFDGDVWTGDILKKALFESWKKAQHNIGNFTDPFNLFVHYFGNYFKF